ncbi:DNA mismatch repair protein MutS isoform 1 [Hibiscus syriacus]|uniref:DNA mismatch repair protein MutS isoform 1 n=1 Tax=Hibiscus syriacus TaxID=106335 RepID=A0A6A3D0J4_HIBSY|nr:DNA mismatch repair protein MutS isoform 1 [Hibiscus syriacus]
MLVVFEKVIGNPPEELGLPSSGLDRKRTREAKSKTLLVAIDHEASFELKWGMAGDGSLVLSDDPNAIQEACCFFINSNGLISVDHPLHKVKAITREDEDGNICGVMFQVDLFTRLPSIPHTGSATNWRMLPLPSRATEKRRSFYRKVSENIIISVSMRSNGEAE